MQLSEMNQQRAFAVRKADVIIQAAESAGRQLNDTERSEYELAMSAISALNPEVPKRERQNTLRQHLTDGMMIQPSET